jgi:hypothetical protein
MSCFDFLCTTNQPTNHPPPHPSSTFFVPPPPPLLLLLLTSTGGPEAFGGALSHCCWLWCALAFYLELWWKSGVLPSRFTSQCLLSPPVGIFHETNLKTTPTTS